MLAAALKIAASLLGLGGALQRWLARREQRRVGRMKAERDALRARNEALRQAQDKLNEQLDEAVHRRPGDARRRLRDGTF